MSQPSDALILAGLSLRQLRLVQALGDNGQMRRAAEHLHMSQPAASKLLSQVELVVGASLFERRPRGLVPTGAGEVLLRHTRSMLNELALAGEEIRALQHGRGGRVAVGSVMAPAVETVAAAVVALRRDRPQLNVVFDIESSDVLVARLLANQLDVVVARIPLNIESSLLTYEELGPERACLVVRDNHPMAGERACQLSDLMQYDWVLQYRGSLLRQCVEAVLRKQGVALPNSIFETSSFLATMVLLSETDAIAPMSVPIAELMRQRSGFSILSITDILTVEPYGIILRRNRELSPAVKEFMRSLRKLFFSAS